MNAASWPARGYSLFGIIEGPDDELAPFGEFDTAGLEQWHECATRLLNRDCGDVAIDLAGLRFIDAAGMGAIVCLGNALAQRGHRLTLRAPVRGVRRAFTAAGLAHLLPA